VAVLLQTLENPILKETHGSQRAAVVSLVVLLVPDASRFGNLEHLDGVFWNATYLARMESQDDSAHV